MRIEELEESDVLMLLKSFENIDKNIPFSNVLFKNLTNTVTSQALLNKEDVGAKFLIQYLHSIYMLPNSRSIDKQQEKDLVTLLEEKLT